MSSLNNTADVVAGLELGAVDYIARPQRMAEVVARVRTQLHIHAHREMRADQTQRRRTAHAKWRSACA